MEKEYKEFDDLSPETQVKVVEKEKQKEKSKKLEEFLWYRENLDSAMAIAQALECSLVITSADNIQVDINLVPNAGNSIVYCPLDEINNSLYDRFAVPLPYATKARINIMWKEVEAAYADWKQVSLKRQCTEEGFIRLVAKRLSDNWTESNKYQLSDEYIRQVLSCTYRYFDEDGNEEED